MTAASTHGTIDPVELRHAVDHEKRYIGVIAEQRLERVKRDQKLRTAAAPNDVQPRQTLLDDVFNLRRILATSRHGQSLRDARLQDRRQSDHAEAIVQVDVHDPDAQSGDDDASPVFRKDRVYDEMQKKLRLAAAFLAAQLVDGPLGNHIRQEGRLQTCQWRLTVETSQ